jgi:RNA polymerase sigma-70 factor (sigma-E family)
MDAEAETAFREFVAARSAALVRAAYLLTGDRGDAEDAVQAALVRVYLAWPRIRRQEAVEAYTRRVLVREVLSWRRRRRVPQLLTAEVPDVVGPERPAADDDLRRALLALPPRQRAVVVLRYYDDLTEAQIADALGVSPGSVKTHASRALAALRATLAEASVEEAT